jgi:hypothetical protein
VKGDKGARGLPGRDGKDGKDGATGATGERGPKGERGDVLYVDDAAVREAATALRNAKKRMLAAIVKARMAAGTLKGEHSRRMANFILDHLDKEING